MHKFTVYLHSAESTCAFCHNIKCTKIHSFSHLQMTDQRQNMQSQNKNDNLTSSFNLFKATSDFCYNIKKFKAVEMVWSVTRTMLRNIYPFQFQLYLVTWSLIAFLASTKFDFISYCSFMWTEELKLVVIQDDLLSDGEIPFSSILPLLGFCDP